MYRPLLLVVAIAGCDAEGAGLDSVASPIVYGTDDRREYFESEPLVRLVVESAVVALMSKRQLQFSPSAVQINAPSLAEKSEALPGRGLRQTSPRLPSARGSWSTGIRS